LCQEIGAGLGHDKVNRIAREFIFVDMIGNIHGIVHKRKICWHHHLKRNSSIVY